MLNTEDRLPQKTEKPWGYELLFAHTPKYAGKVIFVKKGHRLSLQYHEKKDESMYIYQGTVRIEIEEANGCMISKIAPSGYSIRIPPLIKHRLEAIEDATLLEVSTPELEDVVRVEDDYGRARQ
jgi:mannose-6-phosphate isomerase-like protein (cupin superfamily)